MFVAVMLAGVIFILWLAGGEEKEILDLYMGCLEAGRTYDAERLVAALSDLYSYQQVDYPEMVDRIRAEVRRERYTAIEETAPPAVSVMGDGATIDAHLKVRIVELPFPVPLHVRAHLRRESKGWKIAGIEVRRRVGSE